MKNYLFPDIYIKSILDLPLYKLREQGINAFIIDLDNTVTEWNSNHIKPEVMTWLEQVKQEGFKLCITSNGSKKRVNAVAEVLDIPFVSKAGKPLNKAFRKAMETMDATAAETAVIGDQVFTDVLGGNLMQLLTVLVVPISRREFIGTRFMRRLEALVIKRIKQAVFRGEIHD